MQDAEKDRIRRVYFMQFYLVFLQDVIFTAWTLDLRSHTSEKRKFIIGYVKLDTGSNTTREGHNDRHDQLSRAFVQHTAYIPSLFCLFHSLPKILKLYIFRNYCTKYKFTTKHYFKFIINDKKLLTHQIVISFGQMNYNLYSTL